MLIMHSAGGNRLNSEIRGASDPTYIYTDKLHAINVVTYSHLKHCCLLLLLWGVDHCHFLRWFEG